MRRIVYTRPDGGLSVVVPTRNTFQKINGQVVKKSEALTDAAIEQRAWERLPADAINPRWVEDADIPQDRTFRNAWAVDGGGRLVTDMPRARIIRQNQLREMRRQLLEKLDAAYMQADERGDAALKAAIAARKQALRDITQHPEIAAAMTPDDLKKAAQSVIDGGLLG